MSKKRTYQELELRIEELEQVITELGGQKDADQANMIRYRRLAENLPGIVYRVHLRENNHMEFYNRMVVIMTGYEVEELRSGEVCSIDPLILEEDRIRVVKTLKKAVLENKPFEIEYRLNHKDEHVRHFLERGRPVYGCDGRPEFIDGIIMDNTLRKRSEQALKHAHDELENKVRDRTTELESTIQALAHEIEERKKAESRLHQLSRVFMDSMDPIIIEDLSGKIIDINREAERAYGWGRHELIGRSIISIIPSERHQRAKQLRQRCKKGEEVRNWEGMRQDQFGRVFFVLVTAFPLVDESGNFTHIATIAKDITFRKQMESELEKSHQRLQELSRRSLEALENDRRLVSKELHDGIGASLAAVKFNLEGTLEELAEKPHQASMSLEKSISHLLETIRETKRISANLRPSTLDDLGLMATIDWYTRQFSEHYSGIRLIKQIDIREEEIPDLLKIVVYRLLQESLNNAAKHSQADTLQIRLRKIGNQLELELEDNGCGFDVQQFPHRDDPLSGYGLEGMQERVKICGGCFWLHSQPGKGTLIRVELPLDGNTIQNVMAL